MSIRTATGKLKILNPDWGKASKDLIRSRDPVVDGKKSRGRIGHRFTPCDNCFKRHLARIVIFASYEVT